MRSLYLQLLQDCHDADARSGLQPQAASALVRLPPEIRTSIFDYVLGHQWVYPNNHSYNSLLRSQSYGKRLVCSCGKQRVSNHESCSLGPLYLDLFLTCRWVYREALPIFWSTNLFCLQDREVVSSFFKSLRPHQRNLIRSLRLHIENFLGTAHVGWDPAVTNLIWDALSRLQRIQLIIGYYNSPCLPENGRRHRESHLSDFILKVSTLPLKSATVWIRNAKLDKGTFNETHSPNEAVSIEVCAKRIERMLLDKDYVRDQCEKQKSLDQVWARTRTEVSLQRRTVELQRALSSNPYRYI